MNNALKLAAAPPALLFDLDGTLVDSAPDLVAAVAALAAELGEPTPDAAAVSRVVSAGGRAMLAAGLPQLDETRRQALLPRFLEIYAQALHVHTRPYDGVPELLEGLEARAIPWAIVTNKPGWLARPLVDSLGYAARCAALVSGDCLPLKKPDPAPVLHACRLAGLQPQGCLFIGDDLRDIEAGRAAGMHTIAAAWGYLDGGDPHAWGADLVLESPQALARLVGVPA